LLVVIGLLANEELGRALLLYCFRATVLAPEENDAVSY